MAEAISPALQGTRVVLMVLCCLLVACGTGDGDEASIDYPLPGTDGYVDTLLRGITSSMSEEDFFAYCSRANNAGEMRNGDGASVRLIFPDGDTASHLNVQCYPRFQEGSIARLVGKIQHRAWAPWNEQVFRRSHPCLCECCGWEGSRRTIGFPEGQRR